MKPAEAILVPCFLVIAVIIAMAFGLPPMEKHKQLSPKDVNVYVCAHTQFTPPCNLTTLVSE